MQKGNVKILQKDSNPFEFSDDNRRFHTQNYYLRKRFGGKVCKISLNGGFTCPNRDGTKGIGGCIFCSGEGAGEFAGNVSQTIPQQFEAVRKRLSKKWESAMYIAYFQAFSNTYAPVDVLREKYEQALAQKGVVGLSIATRPDCIDEKIVDLLEEFSHKTCLTVELGLQTVHDSTAEMINRCHSYEDFLKSYNLLRKKGIDVCVHIINGLPGEDEGMMLETAKRVAELDPHSVKIHLLHVLKGTPLEKEYTQGRLKVMSKEEYVRVVCRQLLYFNPRTVIERVTGDGAKDQLIAPLWSLKKFTVMNEIDKYMYNNNLVQGMLYKK